MGSSSSTEQKEVIVQSGVNAVGNSAVGENGFQLTVTDILVYVDTVVIFAYLSHWLLQHCHRNLAKTLNTSRADTTVIV